MNNKYDLNANNKTCVVQVELAQGQFTTATKDEIMKDEVVRYERS